MPADVPRQFLDTNVLVYAYDRSAGAKHGRAVELLEALAETEAGAVSVQVLQELFVTITRKLPQPVPAGQAAEVVADLAVMATHTPAADDVLAAIDVHRRLQVSFWDAMVLRSAAALGCAVLWSEDLSHGRRYDDVEVRNPFTD